MKGEFVEPQIGISDHELKFLMTDTSEYDEQADIVGEPSLQSVDVYKVRSQMTSVSAVYS